MESKEIIPAITGVRKEAFDRIVASHVGDTNYYQLRMRTSDTLELLKRRARDEDERYVNQNKPELMKEIAVLEAMLRELNILMAE